MWCNWIVKAWEQIDPAVVAKNANNLDGTEDDILFDDASDTDTSDTDPFANISDSDDEYL